MSNTKCSLFDFKPIIMSSYCAQSVSKVSFSVLNEYVSVSVNLTYVVLISFKKTVEELEILYSPDSL